MHERIFKLLKSIPKKSIFYISNPSDIFYFSGFSGTFARIIAKQKRAYFITDYRYEKVAANLGLQKKYGLIITKNPPKDTEALLSGSNTVLMSRKTTIDEYFFIKKTVKNVEFSELAGEQRMIKDEEEIRLIKESVRISEKGIGHMLDIIKEGISEKDLATELEYFAKKQGAQDMSFPPIIAFGRNSNSPHHITSSKKLKKGDIILMDMGVKYRGYCSDLTRIIAFGIIEPHLKEVKKSYNPVKEAKKISVDLYRIGVFINKAEEKARGFLAKHGLERYFTHSLGHSLGIDIHEPPSCSLKEKGVFKKGMVLTCEPGIYLKDYGIRIEDDYLVTENGPEKLGKMKDDLIIM